MRDSTWTEWMTWPSGTPHWTTRDASTLDPDGDGIPNHGTTTTTATALSTRWTILAIYRSALQIVPELKITKPTATLHQNTYVYVDLLVQPLDASHLRYNTTPLDLASDDKGQIQDLNNSADDVTLFPMVQFHTTSTELTTEYGYLVADRTAAGCIR